MFSGQAWPMPFQNLAALTDESHFSDLQSMYHHRFILISSCAIKSLYINSSTKQSNPLEEQFFILPSWLQREGYTLGYFDFLQQRDIVLSPLHIHAHKHARMQDWSLQNGLYSLTLCDIPPPQVIFICYFPTILCVHLSRGWDHTQLL